MLFVKASVRDSSIEGSGLFLQEFIKASSVVAIYSHGLSIIPENEYLRRTFLEDELVIRTGCRFVSDLFIVRESGVEDEDFVNHSQTPNLLYHCGICFARRDIYPGEELTLNYQYLLSEDEPGFNDSLTGEYVCGLPSGAAMLQSALELAGLFKEAVRMERKNRLKRVQAGTSGLFVE